jgi:hypothetical protein
MGLFDKIVKAAAPVVNNVNNAVNTVTNKKVDVTFPDIPDTLEGFKALPQAALSTPFDTAAMTVAALCIYPVNKDVSLSMLEYLKGPSGINERDRQFLRDRFMDKDYVPRSYFKGATPANDYKPDEPYTITVSENPYSYDDQGYAKLYLQSGGADSPRPIQLRQAKDGKWYLWEQFILADIRKPESADPWA